MLNTKYTTKYCWLKIKWHCSGWNRTRQMIMTVLISTWCKKATYIAANSRYDYNMMHMNKQRGQVITITFDCRYIIRIIHWWQIKTVPSTNMQYNVILCIHRKNDYSLNFARNMIANRSKQNITIILQVIQIRSKNTKNSKWSRSTMPYF